MLNWIAVFVFWACTPISQFMSAFFSTSLIFKWAVFQQWVNPSLRAFLYMFFWRTQLRIKNELLFFLIWICERHGDICLPAEDTFAILKRPFHYFRSNLWTRWEDIERWTIFFSILLCFFCRCVSKIVHLFFLLWFLLFLSRKSFLRWKKAVHRRSGLLPYRF